MTPENETILEAIMDRYRMRRCEVLDLWVRLISQSDACHDLTPVQRAASVDLLRMSRFHHVEWTGPAPPAQPESRIKVGSPTGKRVDSARLALKDSRGDYTIYDLSAQWVTVIFGHSDDTVGDAEPQETNVEALFDGVYQQVDFVGMIEVIVQVMQNAPHGRDLAKRVITKIARQMTKSS